MEFLGGEGPRAAPGVSLEFAQRREQLGRVVPPLLGDAVGHPHQLAERVAAGVDARDAGELVSEAPEVAIAAAIF